jgi:hypothetical protein
MPASEALKGMLPVWTRAFHGHAEIAVGRDDELDGRVHDLVDAGAFDAAFGCFGKGHFAEAGGLVHAGDEALADAGAENAAGFLDGLVREAAVVLDADFADETLDGVADHVAAGDAGLFVEIPEHGGADGRL